MKFTNQYGLLRPLARALANDDYVHHGDFSLTELLKPPQMVQQLRRHNDKVVVEIMNNVWSLMGRAMHYVMSLASIKGAFIEERFIFVLNGKQISCQSDYVYPIQDFVDGKWVDRLVDEQRVYGLIDHKNTSHHAVRDGVKKEWEEQINGYIYAWKQRGINITEAHIAAFLRDWSYTDAVIVKKHGYPEHPIVQVPVPIWPMAKTEAFLEHRLRLHLEAAQLGDRDIPECTLEEQWGKPDRFALLFVDGKSKGNVVPRHGFYRSRVEADHQNEIRREKARLQNGEFKKGFIDAEPQFFKGTSIRCDRYCDAKPFCPQYARTNKKRPF